MTIAELQRDVTDARTAPPGTRGVRLRSALRTTAGCLLLLCGAAGCQPSGGKYAGPRIQLVSVLRDGNPWRNLDVVRDEKPEGIQFRVFLIPANEHKGVLVPGLLHTELYVRHRDAKGEIHREFVNSWNYKTQDYTHKTKPTALGYYYVVALSWVPHDILNREVEFIVSYEDPAGRKAYAQPMRIYVPKEAF
ncbi:MAG: hypothetical protein IT449_02485 [Phycisphaerales bacterium]|nr:hypothetical protein [Phycisphaerales bacterium]